jgi:hypothetical protein
MVLSVFKGNRSKAAKQEAKKIYVKAAMLSGASRDERVFKLRVGLRCRGHMDKAFIEGAKKTESHQQLCLQAIAKGLDTPEAPAVSVFQVAKILDKQIYTYIPPEFSEELFALGGLYQTMQVDAAKAIVLAQEVAARVSLDLGLDDPLVALQFLRDEIMAEIDPSDSEDGGDSEDSEDSEDKDEDG